MTNMNILVTGGSGFLGCRLVRCLQDSHVALAPAHSELDICEPDAIKSFFDAHKPEAVIHCAALSNTGYCEQHPEESYQVNVMATRRLAEACARHGAKFIFISSDQVYNGTPLAGPLQENAPLAPVNHYGRHKLLAEQMVAEVLPSAVGLRLTWMFDRPDSPLRLNTNILVNLAKAGRGGTAVKAATHEHRGMSNVWTVAENICRCLDIPGGVYNFGSANTCNSFDTFTSCAKLMGLPDGIVVKDEERFADQPRNLVMDCGRIEARGIFFPDTLQALTNTIQYQ